MRPLRPRPNEPQWCLRCQLEWTIRECQDVQAEVRAARAEAEEARTQPRLDARRLNPRSGPILGGN